MKKTLLLCSILFFTATEILAVNPWTQKATFGGPGRHRPFGFTVGNQGYVGGGWNGAVMYFDMWQYDPASNTWTQKADVPGQAWTSTGFGIGTKGYLIGGGLTNTMEYNTLTNVWVTKPSLCPGTYWEAGGWVYNGKGYIPNGNFIRIYDPVTDIWTALNSTHSTGWGTAFQIGNKGYCALDNGTDLWEYDMASNFWTQKAFFPGLTRSQARAFSAGGKGYVGTGDLSVPPFDDVADFWEYNPVTNTWRGVDESPFIGRENATTFTIGNRGYLCCGTSGINLQDLWELNPFEVTGNNDLENNSVDVNIFPNPMIESCTIDIGYSQLRTRNLEFQLFDLQGKLVKQMQIHNSQMVIQRGNLLSGTYIYKVTEASNTLATGKLTVQ